MTQILLVESDENLRTIIKLNLMKTLGVEVIEKDSAQEANMLLDILPTIEIVFARAQIEGEKAASKIAQHLSLKNSQIPLIALGKSDLNYASASFIESHHSWKMIIETAGKILGMVPDWQESRLINDFISIPVSYFLNIHNTNLGCDVYIRVKRENEYEYVKRFHSQEFFSREDIGKYVETGLKEFYIAKENFSSFVNYVTNQLVQKLRKSSGGKERVALISESFEVTIDRIHSLGIDQKTIDVVQESIKTIQASLKEGDALSNFLILLKENQLSHISAHSYLTCLILHKIINSFDWNTISIKNKITYLAYFHDISLGSDDLSRINTLDEFQRHEFESKDSKEKVWGHALLSAQLVDRFPKVPLGVSTFIKEHHGLKNGVGFPDTLNLSIAPLSMMFVVVEHFVNEFLKIAGVPTPEQFQGIFSELKKIYNKSTYAQTVQVLENLIANSK